MEYVVVRQPPMYRQMSLDEFLFARDVKPTLITTNESNTKTYAMARVGGEYVRRCSVRHLILKLRDFNESTNDLRSVPRKDLYREFYIPKRSGGLRKIDAPKPELMEALRKLKGIFEDDFGALYHTSAFAYVKHRSAKDALKRHQTNESKWFGKFDFSNFFGSVTQEFVMQQLSMIFPFSRVVSYKDGKEELEKAVELAFLDGGLPQGTPISPLITNIIMIPIDYKLFNTLRNYDNQRYVYTRFADDIHISSKYEFDIKKIEGLILDTLKSFNAPFTLKSEKTRYGSSSGRNWNLGMMLNGQNQITVGYQKKRQFQAMLASYVMDKQHGKEWEQHDIQVMEGYRNYYKMIEGETIDKIVKHVGDKFGVDIVTMIKADLRS